MKNVLILAFLFWVGEAFGTAQAPDLLLYKGKELALHVNPLEEYFEKYPDRRLKDFPVNSGLWRGYIATFEIKKNTLTLYKMITEDWSGKEVVEASVIDRVFPNSNERELLWYSGLLVVPVGEMKNYVHLSYASEYENYILFKVVHGKLVKSKKYTFTEYKKFKNKMFQRYKETDHYRKQYEELSKEPSDGFNLEDFLYQMGDFYQYIEVEL